MNCPRCGDKDAVALVSSVLCPNNKCAHYDRSWADEVMAHKKEQNRKNIKEAVAKLKNSKDKPGYIYDPFGNKIYLPVHTNSTSVTYTTNSTDIQFNNSATTNVDVHFDTQLTGSNATNISLSPTFTSSTGNDVYLIIYY